MQIVRNGYNTFVVSGEVGSGTYPNDNGWHHVAVTYDQSLSSDNAKAYVDGIYLGGFTKTGQVPETTVADEVLRTRGNSADVYSKSKNYTLVSDAKCFRLSRTAKNQKDFKVKALDDWRRQDTYALLVSPLSQYPVDKSQIYPQAFSQNV